MVMLLFLVLLGAIDAPLRRPLSVEEASTFAAVGRVTSGVQGGAGTATLVDHDTLVTAAHLFFNEDGALKGALSEYTFLTPFRHECAVLSATWRRPWDVATAKVRCVRSPQAPSGEPLALADAGSSGPAVLVGFHGDLHGGLVQHIQSCHFVRMPDRVLVSNCEGYPISSGSPLLVRSAKGWLLVGVMVGVGMPENALGFPDWFNRYSLLHPVT